MTTLTNSFEGGTNGTNVSPGNSGGASGNAFDVVSIGASATVNYDNTHIAHGTLANKVATGASAVLAYDAWTTSMGTQTTAWFRQYLYFTANPGANFRIWSALASSTLCGSVLLLTTGALRFINTAGTTIFTTTATVPLNSWFRIEGFLTGSASVGQVELKLFKTPDSITPDEVDTSAANLNTNNPPGEWRFGVALATANVTAWWQDDLGLSSTGYLGPAFTLAPQQPPTVPARRRPGRTVVNLTPPHAAGPPAISGTVQPQATVPVPRRPRPRAFVQFTPVTTVNSTFVPPSGTVQPRATVPVPRRRPGRAVVVFTPVPGVNAIVPVGPPPAVPTSGGTINLTTRVFREIRPGDVPDSGAALPKVTGRAFVVPIPNDVEHTTHAWPEDVPPVPPVPGMLDAIGQAAATAYAASSKAVELGRIFADPPYERQPKKCGAIRKVGGVMLTCGRKPGHNGKHSDRGLDWR